MEDSFIFTAQVLFASGILYGSNIVSAENMERLITATVRYLMYLLIIRGSREALAIVFKWLQKNEGPRWRKLVARSSWIYFMIFGTCFAVSLYMKEKIVAEEFVCLYIAHMVIQFVHKSQNISIISYGTGMACSFMEGYLMQILPCDGAEFVGFEENIRKYEASEGVVFPVKKLFLVITKSLYCPPDLKHFNKTDPNLPYLEACKSLEDVQRDVAGVKRRVYRNSAYKIHRPGGIVYLAAECPTALHTLHKVLQKRAVYEELSDIDPAQMVEDFCSTLKSVLAKMPDCRGKCELVYYDDTDPNQNLADLLLEAIRQIEPNFENSAGNVTL